MKRMISLLSVIFMLVPMISFAKCPCPPRNHVAFHKPYIAPMRTVVLHDTTVVYRKGNCIHWLIPFVAGAVVTGVIVHNTDHNRVTNHYTTIIKDDD